VSKEAKVADAIRRLEEPGRKIADIVEISDEPQVFLNGKLLEGGSICDTGVDYYWHETGVSPPEFIAFNFVLQKENVLEVVYPTVLDAWNKVWPGKRIRIRLREMLYSDTPISIETGKLRG